MMPRRCLPWILLGVFLFRLSAAGGEAGAVDEGRELGKFLSQHGYGLVRAENGDNNVQLIEPVINGRQVVMAVDTGAEVTCVTRSCAHDLGLDVHDTHDQDAGVGGKVAGYDGVALVKSFTLDRYEINRTNILHVLSGDASLGEDGLFGYDFLHLNAAILPVGGRFFLFKPGPAPIPDFDSFMIAMGYQAVPVMYRDGRLKVQGKLNDHTFTAILDCGCAYSLFDSDFVTKTVGISLMGRPLDEMGIDGVRFAAYVFAPRQIELGAFALPNTEMTAGDTALLKNGGAQALIGYDLMADCKAIIDLGHNVLWLKAGGTIGRGPLPGPP